MQKVTRKKYVIAFVQLLESCLFKAERRLQAGDLTAEQHHDLVDKLQQLYALQRHPEPIRPPPQENRLLPNPEHHPRHMIPPRGEEPPFRPGEGQHSFSCLFHLVGL